jgi:tRNA G46 methylase TrmB
LIGCYGRTIVDLGTGDGAAVLHLARRCPRALVIGIDTNASALIEASRRAARAAAKGGLANAAFFAADAAEALTVVASRVDELRITLPWGSLLHAILDGEREFALAVAGAL